MYTYCVLRILVHFYLYSYITAWQQPCDVDKLSYRLCFIDEETEAQSWVMELEQEPMSQDGKHMGQIYL